MPPPPAQGVASRLFAGPALRAQSDRRLVDLVRQGYETAFEEIVRRYAKPLGRYAAAIVPRHRAEDVTQDAFSKALLALRGSEAEIELRPWLFRIVRNTALNDLRDQPQAADPLTEGAVSTGSAFEEAARRAEINHLMERLRALPEPQRAAIVMRELEGLSHEEIAAALGITGGGARQAIYRARRALRDGVGMLMPLPLLKALLAGGGAAAPAGTAAASIAAGGGGAGAGIAFKTAAAGLLVAGTVGTGVAIQKDGGSRASEPQPAVQESQAASTTAPASVVASAGGESGSGEGAAGDDSGGDDGRGGDDDRGEDDSGESGSSGEGSEGEEDGDRDEDRSGPGGGGRNPSSGPGPGGDGGHDGDLRGDSSGPGGGGSGGGGGHSASGGGDGPRSGPGSGGPGSDGRGPGHGGSRSGSGGSGSGSGGAGGSGSGSGGDGSSGSGSGGGVDELLPPRPDGD